MTERSLAPRPEPDDPFAAPAHLNGNRLRDDPVKDYFREIGKVPLINAEQEVLLSKKIEAGLMAEHLLANNDGDVVARLAASREELEQIAEEGKAAKRDMIEANLRLVVSIAKKSYRQQSSGQGLEFIDMISDANGGMIRAVEKFDYTKGYKFSTYATWWIRQSLSRARADHGRTIRIPVHVFEGVGKLQRTRQKMLQQLGRDPEPSELAEAWGIAEERVLALLAYGSPVLSLDKIIGDDTDGATFGDFHAVVPDFTEAFLDDRVGEQFTHKLLSVLDERSRDIVCRRLGLDDGRPQTFAVIGKEWGLTPERIRQIEKNAMERLKIAATHRGNTSASRD